MIEVVAAIVIENRKILCVQRPRSSHPYNSEKFEFPGGKVELNETNHEALAREIQEELNLGIEISRSCLTVEHEYADFAITMHSYICSSSNPSLIELREHIDHKWLHIDELSGLDWAEADVPIVEKLKTCADQLFR